MTIKMEKIKISRVSSEEYPNGRWDKFTLKPVEELIEPITNLFRDLEFGEDVLNDLDVFYPCLGGFNAFYSKDVKAYLIGYEDDLVLIFDTSLPMKEIHDAVEKYFEFPY